jgi:hypothetical protein
MIAEKINQGVIEHIKVKKDFNLELISAKALEAMLRFLEIESDDP